MRNAAIRNSVIAATVASAAILTLPPGAAAAATTTDFQVPARYVAGCLSDVFVCFYLPPVTAVTPAATSGTPGTVTFTARQQGRTGSPDCLDVFVNWRNLTTGAVGTTALRAVTPRDSGPPDEWCRYTPSTAVTDSGAVAATADIATAFHVGGYARRVDYQITANPGFGHFPVP
ncbi:hypothetical protein [Rhodococcus kronopolitis]|uniref:Secreted protein n=1 Tax=Rhodococcus kronopolitis TaxID=1460226 RepID=A0ABV9FYC4_9NOCA